MGRPTQYLLDIKNHVWFMQSYGYKRQNSFGEFTNYENGFISECILFIFFLKKTFTISNLWTNTRWLFLSVKGKLINGLYNKYLLIPVWMWWKELIESSMRVHHRLHTTLSVVLSIYGLHRAAVCCSSHIPKWFFCNQSFIHYPIFMRLPWHLKYVSR